MLCNSGGCSNAAFHLCLSGPCPAAGTQRLSPDSGSAARVKQPSLLPRPAPRGHVTKSYRRNGHLCRLCQQSSRDRVGCRGVPRAPCAPVPAGCKGGEREPVPCSSCKPTAHGCLAPAWGLSRATSPVWAPEPPVTPELFPCPLWRRGTAAHLHLQPAGKQAFQPCRLNISHAINSSI